ncbi:flagellar hook-basal body complex protein FliE [Kibdelosporangium banguiense]|uniref:Flagellar hook-basal body complex protein FliE n=1 Tax=Kibdelosporangium banguiense TaxID=1365924 RepID=A0ABS4TKU9_9PSEU|nr:hypothetical protein [Kibdelosporangium banguiense]MBP2325042.1 flagellar hook-basal body complex protein FliE [Kibdelosporangium banguiense]
MYDDQPVQPADMSKRLSALAANMATLRHDIESGQLTLDPEAGKQIRDMLAKQIDQVDGWLEQARGLARRAPLGENPVGHAMAGKFEQRAGGEGTSFAAVFSSYRQVLQDTDDTVGEAMRLYRETEDRTSDTFKKLAN